jgi:hypothetical protein
VGGDPDHAMGRADFDLGNQDPGQLLRNRQGVFPRSIYDTWTRIVDDDEQRADFASVFLEEDTHDNAVALDILANLLTYVGVHELGHSLGLVAGDEIAAFADDPPDGVTRFADPHNNNGEDTPGGLRVYMDQGRHATFREVAFINVAAERPFTFDEYGMDLPQDWSAVFKPVNLQYLQRLLPTGAQVP